MIHRQFDLLGRRWILQLAASVPDGVRGGPKRERWGRDAWLYGFRRHYLIVDSYRRRHP